MKRWTARVLILLLLLFGGAIVNLAVAWVVPQYGPMKVVLTPSLSSMQPLDRSNDLVGELALDQTLTAFSQQRFYGRAFDRHVVYATDGVGNRSITHLRCGWPMRCLTGTNTSGIGLANAIEVPQRLTNGQFRFFLPTRPIWPALLINTLFYALVCCALWFGPGMIRRRIRSARGRCIKCGYDLQGSPNEGECPECGWGRET